MQAEATEESKREARRKRHAEYVRKFLNGKRAEWLAANGPCRHCGATENLQIDHIDPATKNRERIRRQPNYWTWDEASRIAELAKCQVLCKPCHLEKSRAESRRPITHGLVSSYRVRACRCDECRAVGTEANRQWRAKVKAAKAAAAAEKAA